jgi:predicted Zn-dependent protease
MGILTEAEAKAILDKVIKLSKADECTATLSGAINGNIRFALNNVSTSGVVTNTELGVQVAFGKRVGIATINAFDDASLERVVRRAEDLAKLAPENPEFMPAVGKQTYTPTNTFSEATAAITPVQRAEVAAKSITPCKQAKLIAAGFLSDGQGFSAFANSNGNFGYHRSWSRFGLGGAQPSERRRLQAGYRNPDRHEEGRRLRRRQGAGARQIYGHSGTGGLGGPDLVHDELF